MKTSTVSLSIFLLLPAIIHAQAGSEPGTVSSDDETAEYCECELVAPKSPSGVCLDFGGVVPGQDGLAYCEPRGCIMRPGLACKENGKDICLITRQTRDKLKFLQLEQGTGRSTCTLGEYNATTRTVVGPNPNYIAPFPETTPPPEDSPADEPIPEAPEDQDDTTTPSPAKRNCTCGFVAPKVSTGICLDFVSLIPGEDEYVYCAPRTCAQNPSLKCIATGTEVCEITEGPKKDVLKFDHYEQGTQKSLCTYETKSSQIMKIITE
eukprot:CAMPEP_0174899696 /NCGR_PEP_ID=MMETSP0167-20121228/28397_1 /TAXON_ID=38298 /ORGANISM="Rhodella maculata, Strain CCMP736" /LENGTH=264 /DNA_ID=CAMNT_0016140803 /DNA_START=31 /DNA_END=825 /DNA_ORIENTATION=+